MCENALLVISVWNGVVFVRQGLYQDGVFRFNIEFAANFPDCDCPVNSSFRLFKIIQNFILLT